MIIVTILVFFFFVVVDITYYEYDLQLSSPTVFLKIILYRSMRAFPHPHFDKQIPDQQVAYYQPSLQQ